MYIPDDPVVPIAPVILVTPGCPGRPEDPVASEFEYVENNYTIWTGSLM